MEATLEPKGRVMVVMSELRTEVQTEEARVPVLVPPLESKCMGWEFPTVHPWG